MDDWALFVGLADIATISVASAGQLWKNYEMLYVTGFLKIIFFIDVARTTSRSAGTAFISLASCISILLLAESLRRYEACFLREERVPEEQVREEQVREERVGGERVREDPIRPTNFQIPTIIITPPTP